MTRFKYVKELANELIKPFLEARLQVPTLQRDVRGEVMELLAVKQNPRQGPNTVPSDTMAKRKTCAKCPSAKKRKTQYKCIRCDDAICLECSRKVCVSCAPECINQN